MTTICYDHRRRTIHYDSRLTDKDTIVNDDYDKKVTNSLGTWFYCGEMSDRDAFVDQLYRPNLDGGAYLVTEGKVFFVTVDHKRKEFLHFQLTYNHAIGSGRWHAITALDLDQTGHTALYCAKRRDYYTGGKTRVYRIKTAG